VPGPGTIAQRLGLTKSQIQQITNTPTEQIVAAYAFRYENHQWYGQQRLLRQGGYREAPTFTAFDPPADPPLGGQTFTITYGAIAHDQEVSVYTVQIRQDDGSPSTCG